MWRGAWQKYRAARHTHSRNKQQQQQQQAKRWQEKTELSKNRETHNAPRASSVVNQPAAAAAASNQQARASKKRTAAAAAAVFSKLRIKVNSHTSSLRPTQGPTTQENQNMYITKTRKHEHKKGTKYKNARRNVAITLTADAALFNMAKQNNPNNNRQRRWLWYSRSESDVSLSLPRVSRVATADRVGPFVWCMRSIY